MELIFPWLTCPCLTTVEAKDIRDKDTEKTGVFFQLLGKTMIFICWKKAKQTSHLNQKKDTWSAMCWCIFFFPLEWLWKTWRSYETPQISLHTCFVFQKAASLLRCQLLRKISLCFQSGLVKPSLQPPVALFRSSCQWRCIHRSSTCKYFRCTGGGANNSCTTSFPHWGHVLPSCWHLQTEDVTVLCCWVCLWAGKAL